MGRVTIDHWALNARRWASLGPPLKPSPVDVAIVAEAARERARDRERLDVLLVGVTPELATVDWPTGTRLVALDRSAAMVRDVWPRRGVPDGADALCADWLALPVAGASIDFVAGDASCNTLAYPGGYRALVHELRRVLRPGGTIVTRVFVQPAEREPLDRVAADLAAGRIASFDAFKLRLLMALQGTSEAGVALRDAWTAWRALAPSAEVVAGRLGWSPDVFATIEVYRDASASYSFPTLAEVRAVLAENFVELACRVPPYALGSRCPTLVLARR
jgi:SAM-dependent methyltransferase